MRVAGLLLAAGRATRMGRPKLAERLDGETMADHALDTLRAARLDPIVVVVPPAPAAAALFPNGARDAEVVVNPAPGQGLSSSLRLGLGALGSEVDAVLIALADMPLVTVGTCRELIAAWRADRTAVAPFFGLRRGNPVLVKTAWAREIAGNLEGDQGLGRAFETLGDQLVRVPAADEAVLFDVDYPQDLGRWRAGV
jgi:molybdenum cofactor cytidylyltransferase